LQYLFDAAEKVRLESLVSSGYAPHAQAAAKLRPEEAYHERHTRAWVLRLGDGSSESNHRMQRALDGLWGYALTLFEDDPGARPALRAQVVTGGADLRCRWEDEVRATLDLARLVVPEEAGQPPVGRRQHTDHLVGLLEELQSVARSDPTAVW
jgi:ring-1,2-phenylacetyl-CoA epoxidase subunit PaaC